MIFIWSTSSCKKNSINISKHEYGKNKREGFWFFRTRKAISYNQNVVKPKRDRENRKIIRENKSTEKYNNKYKTKYNKNDNYLKTFQHH